MGGVLMGARIESALSINGEASIDIKTSQDAHWFWGRARSPQARLRPLVGTVKSSRTVTSNKTQQTDLL
jgi:hypothetical protein